MSETVNTTLDYLTYNGSTYPLTGALHKKRSDWHTYFMDIAEAVSRRATCPRASVGAVIVKDNRLVATGYNGALAGSRHCTDEGVGCKMVDGHCKRTMHAEMNAVAYAARNGVSLQGTTLYLYGKDVCRECRNVLIAAGVEFYMHRKTEAERMP